MRLRLGDDCQQVVDHIDRLDKVFSQSAVFVGEALPEQYLFVAELLTPCDHHNHWYNHKLLLICGAVDRVFG